jgi:4-hydroxy-tetrahydrodipicolinate reductase
MVNIIICGAAGRMGKENIAVCNSDEGARIAGAIELKNSNFIGQDAGSVSGIDKIGVTITSNLEKIIQNTDVLIDFTTPEATLSHLKIAHTFKKGMVIGTTGFSDDQIAVVKEFSKDIPIVLSPNMSQGVNVLFFLVKKAAEFLGDRFEAEILEIHHNLKQDAPSGTALQFGRYIAEARGKKLDDIAVYGRHGVTGPRKKEELGIAALRLSDVVGEHSIIFGSTGEIIEINHKCTSRKTYASGALRAAKFIVNKRNGIFTMQDVLGIQ